MNRKRFLMVGIVVVAIILIAQAFWMYVYPPPTPETCSPYQEEVLAKSFKARAIVFGIFGAVIALVVYCFMLRLQTFFPGTDAKRLLSATLSGTLIALAFTLVDLLYAHECLRKALGSNSAISDRLPAIMTFAELIPIGHAWLALFLDQLLLAFIFVTAARVYREVSLRSS